ncbi:hypothetical protein JB92DRAFT_2834397 [Gautieria morchelliformis]|nr:hypothetical protein JB92DRAFT_2834397 [Gautieria morchelliformis]
MDWMDQKRYADIGTQTSPFKSPLMAISPTVTSTLAAVRPRLPNLAHSDCPPCEAPPGRKEYVSTNKYRYSSDTSTYDHTLPLLPSFPSSFGLQRHTTSSRLNPTGNRSVSLPETLYDEDLHLVLSQLIENNAPEVREHPRVVSMPESVQLHAQRSASASTYGYRSVPSIDEIACNGKRLTGGEDLRSNSSTPSTPGTVVMHSLSSEQYTTPSPPPSSCDSVEFTLEDPARMPDSFLRGSNTPPTFVSAVADKAVGVLEDDGWLTWANSPPRPIPALHGPSSLPYARCPSGAEGTIIGEPSSLPRMIWGLDPNDAVTSHVPQPQPSRVVSIKTPAGNFKSRPGNHQGPPSSVSTSAIFSSPHVGPRFGNPDMNCNSSGQPQIGGDFSISMPTALEARREEDPRSTLRRTTRGDPDLGLDLTVLEEPLRLEPRFERSLHDDSIIDYPHPHRVGASNAMDRGFRLLSDEKDPQHQRPPGNRKQEEIYRHHSYASGSRKGHPSNLIELLSSPVNLLDRASNKYSRVAAGTPRLSAQGFPPSFLPTPPNSSSPQWTSVFSPVRNNGLSTAGFSHVSSNISAGIVMRQRTNTTNDELSDELRRFVFENMPPVSSANAQIDAFQASRMSPTSAANVFLAAHNALRSSKNPTHPPGLPTPQHILLSKALEPSDPFSESADGSSSPKSAPPSGSSGPYTRSTLSNPRSIPLSRLRQKRGAIKLPTVPEEDSAEPQLHDMKLAPPAPTPRLLLRTPSPLDGRLHAQSMEEKATFGEDIKQGQARVKLPHSAKGSGSAQRTNLDSSQNAPPQSSPKQRRLQRRKRPTKLVDAGKPGFPLASEGTVSFGSSTSHATQDVRAGEDQLDQLVGKDALDKQEPTAREREQGMLA